MGRPRRLRSEQEEEERKERRRAQQREWLRNKRRRAAIALSSTVSSGSESLAREEKIARLERRREQNRECKRRRRANATDEDRAREAERKREARRRQGATPAEQFPGATARFWREFVENPFGVTCDRDHFGPDEFQISPGRTSGKKEKNANGWGGSSDESMISANTIKTEPPEYVEQDEEPGSHFASVKSESELYGVDWKPHSLVPALTKDYVDVTEITVHLNAEPQVSKVTQRHDDMAVAVKIEPQDATEVCTEEVPVGTGLDGSIGNGTMAAVTIKTEPPEYVEQDEEPSCQLVSVKSEPEYYEEVSEPGNPVPALTKEPQVSKEAQQRGNAAVAVKIEPQDPTEVDDLALPAETGVDGSSGNGTMAAVTIKTEPPEYVEQDEEPSCHVVSVKSEPECYEDVWEPGNPVAAITEGVPPDPMDLTKVTFHTNPEPLVSEEAQQHGNAAVAVKIEPQDLTEVDDPALSAETGLGGAAAKEFQQDAVPGNPIGSYSVLAHPPQQVFPSVSDKAQPQVKVIYFRKVEQGIAMQPVVTTLPVAAVQCLLAAESQQPCVRPVWLPGPALRGESGAQQSLAVQLNAGPGSGAASSREVEQHQVHVDPTLPLQPPRHAPSAVCEPQEDLVQFHEVEQS
ncbi:hypothetical protein HPB47_007943 [Ixodes persulcatus]|uniref:Uncharacterized protein n=1 Tax=Ixodes persulcatus TaxID=34615 RepID=A0AC60P674_IXOPE|nr:hypothetical protein HPB47_007943 [Ixodes persulcatus]